MASTTGGCLCHGRALGSFLDAQLRAILNACDSICRTVAALLPSATPTVSSVSPSKYKDLRTKRCRAVRALRRICSTSNGLSVSTASAGTPRAADRGRKCLSGMEWERIGLEPQVYHVAEAA